MSDVILRADIDQFLTGSTNAESLAAIGAASVDSLNLKADLIDEHIDPTQLPESLTLDYITLGEIAPQTQVPEGSLARDGTTLVIYDSEGNPIPIGGNAIENTIPYHRVSGVATMIPYGVAGSRAKRAGTRYWQEISRVKIPGADILHGNILQFIAEINVKSTTAISPLARGMLLVPSGVWDIPDQSILFGASPTSTNFNTSLPSYLGFRQSASSSLESTSRTARSHELVISGGNLSALAASAGTHQYGYNWTAGAAFSGTDTTIMSGVSYVAPADLELVLVAASSATATDFRRLDFNLSVSATAP